MNKAKIAAVGIVALALTGIGVGSAVAATPAPAPSGSNSSVTPDTGTAAETPGTEAAGTEVTETPGTETAGTEASTPSDGPGGWADPAGADVNSQGGAQQ